MWFLAALATALAVPGDLDDDAVPDALEQPGDSDGDGIPDVEDPDDDGDGVPTILEDWLSPGDPLLTNTDAPDPGNPLDMFAENGDSIPDYLDPDDDGDGIPTIDEDLDGDGDPLDDDSDAFWSPACASPFTDPQRAGQITAAVQLPGIAGCSDGRPDFRDPDDDGDGAPTWAEVANHVDPGRAYLPDTDGDGILDGMEWLNLLDLAAMAALRGGPDALGQARALWADAAPCGDPTALDAAGLPDGTGKSWANPWDRDCDGLFNFQDLDDDGDGLPTDPAIGVERPTDVDCLPGTGLVRGDGVPNHLDVDSDDQTAWALGGSHPSCPVGPACPLRFDGEETDWVDSDGDSLVDAIDCFDQAPGLDGDLDGLSNGVEDLRCPTDPARTALCPPGFAAPCSATPDADCDGLLDCREAGAPCPGDAGWVPGSEIGPNDPFNPPDTDGDGLADPWDPDDDGDGIPTFDERLACPNGSPVPAPGWRAVDAVVVDGVVDAHAHLCEDGASIAPGTLDANGDGTPDHLQAAPPPADADGDGVPDDVDPDDTDGPLGDPDGDGLSNETELAFGLDPRDPDSDGDGFPDGVELDPEAPADADGDTFPDALDPDDDGDGVPTSEQGAGDFDGDGVLDAYDLDDDGDGIDDGDEPGDADCDGAPDRRDLVDDDACEGDPPDDADLGCGCAQAPSGAPWLLALAGLALARRPRATDARGTAGG